MLVLGQGCLRHADLREAIDDPGCTCGWATTALHRRARARPGDRGRRGARRGLPGHEYPEPHMYFGGVGAAHRAADGSLQAAGDRRRDAAVGVA